LKQLAIYYLQFSVCWAVKVVFAGGFVAMKTGDCESWGGGRRQIEATVCPGRREKDNGGGCQRRLALRPRSYCAEHRYVNAWPVKA
jgi:hypothetical protein